MNAKWTKLADGSWGVRGLGTPPKPGQRINVVKKDGTGGKLAKIAQVIWTGANKHEEGGDAWLATVEGKGATGRHVEGSQKVAEEKREKKIDHPEDVGEVIGHYSRRDNHRGRGLRIEIVAPKEGPDRLTLLLSRYEREGSAKDSAKDETWKRVGTIRLRTQEFSWLLDAEREISAAMERWGKDGA